MKTLGDDQFGKLTIDMLKESGKTVLKNVVIPDYPIVIKMFKK